MPYRYLFFPVDTGLLAVIGTANLPDLGGILGGSGSIANPQDSLGFNGLGASGEVFGEDVPALPDGGFGNFGDINLGSFGGEHRRGSISLGTWGELGGFRNPRDRARWGADDGGDGDAGAGGGSEGQDQTPGATDLGDIDATDLGDIDATDLGEVDDEPVGGDPGDAGADAGTTSLPGGVGDEPIDRAEIANDVEIAGGVAGVVAGVAGGVGATTAAGGVAAGAAIVGGSLVIAHAILTRTPNPEDDSGARAPHLYGGTVGFGGGLRDRHRFVRVDGEWDAGQSYGWVHFGAPRAVTGAMPADDGADERVPAPVQPANTRFAISFGSGGQDEWWTVGQGWGWKRFGAPRA